MSPPGPSADTGSGPGKYFQHGPELCKFITSTEQSVQLTALTYILSTAQCVTRTLITLITLPSSQYTRVTNSPSVPPPSSLAVLTLWTTLAHCWAMSLSSLSSPSLQTLAPAAHHAHRRHWCRGWRLRAQSLTLTLRTQGSPGIMMRMVTKSVCSAYQTDSDSHHITHRAQKVSNAGASLSAPGDQTINRHTGTFS